MSDVEQVSVVSDNGHRQRWGYGLHLLYRPDGKKLTIKGKVVLGIVVGCFILSSVFVLMRGPTQMDIRSPIVFNGIVSSVSTIDVPPAAEESLGRKSKSGQWQSVTRYSGLEVVSRPRLGQIPPGTVVKAKLLTGASNGLIKAVLTESLTANGDGIADSGTVLVGRGSSSEDRLLIDFTKMVFRDGTVQTIKGQGCDLEDQTVGIKGSKVSKYASMLATGAGLNFAGGLAEGLQDTEVQNGVAVKKTDLKNAALNGASRAALDTSKEILEKWKQEKTVIQVKEGTEICIIFDGE